MESIPEVPEACHDSTQWRLQDTERGSPTHKVHPPLAFAFPLADPPPRP
jgi:hypothetical protein